MPCTPLITEDGKTMGFICSATVYGMSLRRTHCPNCGRSRFFLCVDEGPWYGYTSTCLRCGDRWMDGECCPRPFKPGWRKENVARAKAQYRAWVADGRPVLDYNDAL